MTVPAALIPTPNAVVSATGGVPFANVTSGIGAANTTAQNSFWQLTAGGFIVYDGVPNAIMQNLLALSDRGGGVIDSAIAQQLAGYPKRVVSATSSSPS